MKKVNKEGKPVPELPDDPLFWALREVFTINRVKAHNLSVKIDEHERMLTSLTRQRDESEQNAQSLLQHAERMGWDLKGDK